VANPLTAQLAQIWEELLDVRPIGLRQDCLSLVVIRCFAARMANRVARCLAGTFPSRCCSRLRPSPSCCGAGRRTPKRQPLILVQAGSDRRPLFFFDGDWLGNGLYCRSLARLIDEERPFYSVAPHGVDGKPVPPSIQAMAADRLDALLAAQPEGPFLLGGYCAGGLVALETARLLEPEAMR